MRFKKIYIEITNICNLKCPFCPPHNRENKYMSFDEFKTILDKIKPYTNYIYLHVKGEPMLHPDFDKFVKYAFDEGFFVNVTTNGTLLENHLNVTKFIRQLNISLHATNDIEIFKKANEINDCIVNFRIWNGKDIIPTNYSLGENHFISLQNEFEWPDISKESMEKNGYCHATKDHIAILVDGTVVPCCLDNNGDINLGNIFNQELEDILNSERFIKMQEGFKNRVCVEKLCQNCTYKNRF